MKNRILYITLVLFLTNCKKDTGREIEELAQYKVTFNLNWNSTDFPQDYPSNAHFSKVIGWSHNSSSTFFNKGTTASVGIKDMAELGTISPLDNEIATKIANKEGHQLVVGGNLAGGVGTIVLDDVEVAKDFPLISLVSMLAPSPDWYIGTLNVLLNKNNEFVTEKTVNIIVYDAGTDSGVTFSTSDSITSPQQLITLLVKPPLGNGSVINQIIGTATFIKQ